MDKCIVIFGLLIGICLEEATGEINQTASLGKKQWTAFTVCFGIGSDSLRVNYLSSGKVNTGNWTLIIYPVFIAQAAFTENRKLIRFKVVISRYVTQQVLSWDE